MRWGRENRANLRSIILERPASGAEWATLELPAAGHPWDRFVGGLPDDSLTREWPEMMAARRRDADAEDAG